MKTGAIIVYKKIIIQRKGKNMQENLSKFVHENFYYVPLLLRFTQK